MDKAERSEQRAWLQNRLVTVEHQRSTPGTGDMAQQSREIEDLKMQLARLDDADGIPGPQDLVAAVRGEMNWTGLDIRVNRTELVVRLNAAAEARLEILFRSVIAEQIGHALREAQLSRRRRSAPGTLLGIEHA